jgi:hypothetical protein
MKNVFSSIVVFTFTFTLIKGQSKQQRQQHDSLSHIANNYFDKEDYVNAANSFSKAFIALGNKGFSDDRYKAAISWSNCGNRDSAFAQLFKLQQKTDYLDHHKLSTSADFNFLHSDSRWNELLKALNPNNESFNDSLAVVLDTIRTTDQKYRSMIRIYTDKFGWNSVELNALKKKMIYYDSLNVLSVCEMLDHYGWLSPVVVGRAGNTTLWLVIQHADLKIQEKYFPVMQKAVQDGKASKKDLAYLQDRILMRQGKKQIYGTQYQVDKDGKQVLWEVEDPDNLQKRRASVGM